MKILSFILVSLSMLTAFALEISSPADCQQYSVRCECFPAAPFEGYKLYVVEKCDGEEKWHTDFNLPMFDSDAQCRESFATDPVCLSLKN